MEAYYKIEAIEKYHLTDLKPSIKETGLLR